MGAQSAAKAAPASDGVTNGAAPAGARGRAGRVVERPAAISTVPAEDAEAAEPQATAAAHDEVLVLDFGGQYSQLIARRVRECGVFSELLPHSAPLEEIRKRQAQGPDPLRRPGVGVRGGEAVLRAQLLKLGPRHGRAVGVHRRRAAGEDQALGLALPDLLQRRTVGQQLAEHPALAHAAGNQLAVLATEVQHQHLVVRGRGGLGLGGLGVLRRDRGNGRRPLHYSTSAASGWAGAAPLVTPSDAGAALAADCAPMPMAWSRWSCLPSVCSDGATMTSARWNEAMSS